MDELVPGCVVVDELVPGCVVVDELLPGCVVVDEPLPCGTVSILIVGVEGLVEVLGMFVMG